MFFQTGEFDFTPFPVREKVIRDPQSAPRAVIVVRSCRLLLHIVAGLLRAAFVLPFCSRRHVESQMRRWSQQLLQILGIQVQLDNALALLPMPGRVVVMNHISWLDVFVLNSVLPCRFVAKADVKHWPLIGFLCQQAGTLFLDRQRRRAASSVNRAMVNAIAQGEMVALFPEGTTTRGNQLKPFKPALFQAAIDARTAVVPIVLHYQNSHGCFSDVPAYIGDMTLVQSIFNIVSQRLVIARITVLPAIACEQLHRTVLAEKTEQAMYYALNKK